MISNSLNKVVSWPIFIRLASVGINFLYGVVIARMLDPSESGVFFLVLSFIVGGATFSRVGGDFIILKVATKPTYESRELLFFLWVVLFGFLASASVLAIIFALTDLLQDSEPQRIQLIFLLIATVLPSSLLTVTGAFLRGAGNLIFGTILESGVVQLGTLISIMFLNIFMYVSALEAIVTYCIVSYVIATLGLRRAIRIARSKITSRPEFVSKYSHHVKEHFRPLVSSGIASSLYYLSSFLPILLIASNVSSEGVAFYSVASRLAAVILVFSAIQITVAGPAAASTINNNKSKKELNSLLKRQINLGVLIGLPISIALVVNPTFWINLVFGNQYLESSTVLVVLVIGFYLSMFFGNSLHLLQIVGLEKYALYISISIVLIWLIIGFPVSTSYGVVGVSYVSSIVVFVSCAFGSIFLYKKLGIWSFVGKTND